MWAGQRADGVLYQVALQIVLFSYPIQFWCDAKFDIMILLWGDSENRMIFAGRTKSTSAL